MGLKDSSNTEYEIQAGREAIERHQIMLEALPLACNFFDAQFNNIDCNQAAPLLFDLPDKANYLKAFYKLSPRFQPDGSLSERAAQLHLRKAFEEGFYRFEWTHQKLDGSPIPCEISLVRTMLHGRFVVAGYIRDLREVRAMEAQRDMQRRILRQILDTSPVCFIITVGGKVSFINPFGQNLTGLSVGQEAGDICVDKEQMRDIFIELYRVGEVVWRPLELRCADGQSRSMLINAHLADYHGQQAEMCWLMDVTELKRARAAAEESERLKGVFLANMSHEIRTPLNGIVGLLHLLEQTELNDIQRQYLRKVDSSAQILLRVINDILDFSKIKAGKIYLERVPFRLHRILETVGDIIRNRLAEKGLKFNLELSEPLPETLLGDPVRLEQILTNLLNNAVKFTHQGRVSLKVAIVERDERSLMLRFEVEDTGIGLSPEQISHLFSEFFQAELSTTRHYGGTGLGLSIAKRLVELMGGEIGCESQPGQGSRFIFTAKFDLDPGGSQAEAPTPDSGRDQSIDLELFRQNFAGAKILLAEDNEINQLVASRILARAGLDVSIVSNGLQAVEMAHEHDYDLILMDIQMPDMDGFTATAQITAQSQTLGRPRPPIIAMTAHAMPADRALSLKAGLDDHINKPLDVEQLFKCLSHWLKASRGSGA